ncbi:hypothetical protein MMC10_002030 [Thelotrema lepadinum]|nr:hypothetical protein [Thelotrema lepadinum]
MQRPLASEFSVNGLGLTSDLTSRRRKYPEPADQETSDFVGARSAWEVRPRAQAMDRDAARSRSPVPEHRQNSFARSRTPSRPVPSSRYHYIPREYHSPPKLTLEIPPSYRPVAPQPRQLPPSRNAQNTTRGRSDSDESRPAAGPVAQQTSQLLPRHRPGGQSTALAPLMPKPLHIREAGSRQARKQVESMVEYLSLEQLENMWQSQDMYLGTVVAPQKPKSPMWRIEEDPRSPVLPVHPAFRNDPENDPNFNNSFSRTSF